jgi:hypothetical protein
MPTTFSGVWQPGTGKHFVWVDAGWVPFKAVYDQVTSQGLLPVALDTYVQRGQRLWAGAWVAGEGKHFVWAEADWDHFKAVYDLVADQDLRLVALRSYAGQGQRLWAGAWRSGTGKHFVWVDAAWDAFKAIYDQVADQGLRLAALDTYVAGGQRLWAGAWVAGQGKHYIWAEADWDHFKAVYDLVADQGLRLAALRSYTDQGRRLWAGAWVAGKGKHFVWAEADWDHFKAKYDEVAAKDMRLVDLDVAAAAAAHTVVLHAKVLADPLPDLPTALASMQLVYGAWDLDVDLRSVEQLQDGSLADLPVGECGMGAPTPEQQRLFANRQGVGPNEMVAYFVRSTIPPYNGCAAYPGGLPGAVIAQHATRWTLGHEIGHVMGLEHVDNNHQLMTGNGTSNITNPPPILDPDEAAKMIASPYMH